jgi:alpha-tubulin suppressor-like RCC1 family protein
MTGQPSSKAAPTTSGTCWGANTFGQLGNGTTMNSLVPTLVTGLGGEALEVTAGIQHACARLATNQIKCWGYNVTGQLGDRSVTVKTSPVLTGNGLAANVVVAGGSHTCAMTSTFDLYCWGYNGNGQLANGTRNNAFIPTKAVFEP